MTKQDATRQFAYHSDPDKQCSVGCLERLKTSQPIISSSARCSSHYPLLRFRFFIISSSYGAYERICSIPNNAPLGKILHTPRFKAAVTLNRGTFPEGFEPTLVAKLGSNDGNAIPCVAGTQWETTTEKVQDWLSDLQVSD